MFTRIAAGVLAVAGLFGLAAGGPAGAQSKADAAKAKKALQEVQEFIGQWEKLEGTQKVGGKTVAWKEDMEWGWRFKGDDAWIHIESKGGKLFDKGDLKYLPAKKKYQLTAEKGGKAETYEGPLVRGTLTLERTDAANKDVHRIKLNTLGDGVRIALAYEKQDKGVGLFDKVFQVVGNKAGESLAGSGSKKPECIVTGGAASMAVSYNGETFYGCCSGCRDEFNANPKKFVDAFKSGKKP